MTNYNDGEWHRWRSGFCPVHPESEVEVRLLDSTRYVSDDMVDYGRNWLWTKCPSDGTSIIAFRVTKVYEEPKVPREYWLADGYAFKSSDKARGYNRLICCDDTDIIHVREVLPE